MANVKVTISIPEEIYREVQQMNRKISHVISEALEEHLRKQRIAKAKASFGSWKGFEGDSTAFVRAIRDKDERLKDLGVD